MAYLSEVIVTDCKGRAHPRPRQFDTMTTDEQSQHCSKYADIHCKDCSGDGGHYHTDTFDHGYYSTTADSFEPCDCVINNQNLKQLL